jgi:hypothetical protein
VCQVAIQSQSLAAVAADAAESFNRVGGADFRQVCMAREAIFQLSRQYWREGDGTRSLIEPVSRENKSEEQQT